MLFSFLHSVNWPHNNCADTFFTRPYKFSFEKKKTCRQDNGKGYFELKLYLRIVCLSVFVHKLLSAYALSCFLCPPFNALDFPHYCIALKMFFKKKSLRREVELLNQFYLHFNLGFWVWKWGMIVFLQFYLCSCCILMSSFLMIILSCCCGQQDANS